MKQKISEIADETNEYIFWTCVFYLDYFSFYLVKC